MFVPRRLRWLRPGVVRRPRDEPHRGPPGGAVRFPSSTPCGTHGRAQPDLPRRWQCRRSWWTTLQFVPGRQLARPRQRLRAPRDPTELHLRTIDEYLEGSRPGRRPAGTARHRADAGAGSSWPLSPVTGRPVQCVASLVRRLGPRAHSAWSCHPASLAAELTTSVCSRPTMSRACLPSQAASSSVGVHRICHSGLRASVTTPFVKKNSPSRSRRPPRPGCAVWKQAEGSPPGLMILSRARRGGPALGPVPPRCPAPRAAALPASAGGVLRGHEAVANSSPSSPR